MIAKKRRWMTGMLAGAMLFSTAAAGCSNANTEGAEPTGASSAAPSAAAVSASPQAQAAYPLKTDKQLTYWAENNTTKPTMGDAPFFQEYQKQTGVPLKFISPPAGQTKETLNVLLASGDLPDMIEYDWFNYPGGPEKAIADGYILKLNDLIDKYAPNLKKYLQEHPEVDKMVKTDNGSYYVFPFLRGDPSLQVFRGPIIRQDWLNELGLAIPETMDDWYNVLKAFKEKKGAAAPLSIQGLNNLYSGEFVGAYNAHRNFFQQDGKVVYGPLQPGYKDFLTTFHKWYAEGLIDKDVGTTDSKALDANITSGASGATIGNTGGGMGKWAPILKEKDAKAKLAPAPYPVLKKGDTPILGQKGFAYSSYNNVAITAKSKNVELAVRMLDWGYSEEGHMFHNFGQEGVTYKLESGQPKYTDLLMNNPDKLAPSQAMSLHIRANTSGPFVQDKRYIDQYLALPEQKEAIVLWAKTNVDQYQLPLITPTPEEASEFAKIMNDVNTLVEEMTLKIILGTESVDSYEPYVEKIKKLKIDRATEIQQAALDRYNKR
ncbi:MAG: transporter substrate-binding protein [Paenibacillaceae bacterium]|jgi:putative aldouronate transport system substrate-binding protein|nr:transporter substrate-binding protein [Paenibacillaceae bacterium]